MKVLITGDSHTAAMRWGMDTLIQNGNDANLGCQVDIKPLGKGGGLTQPFFEDKGDFALMLQRTRRHFAKRLPDVAEDGSGYDYYAFSGLLHTVRIWRHKQDWANFTPLLSDEGQHPVSTSLLGHIIAEDQKYQMELVDLLLRLNCQVVVIEAPKPFKHHPLVQTKPEVVAYLDSFYRDYTKSRLQAKNVPVIEVPSFCYDDGGFMKEQFRSPKLSDSHHGNSEFGVIMINEVAKFVTNMNQNSPQSN